MSQLGEATAKARIPGNYERDSADKKPELLSQLSPFLRTGLAITSRDGIPAVEIPQISPGMQANAYYFSHPKWVMNWLTACHRYPEFVSRWRAATGPWDGKIVVDIGCGPGNVFASVGGSPEVLIGVDIASYSLQVARDGGYLPLLADAHDLPLNSGFADIVCVCSTLHHVDDMGKVLAEAARLVRPGGILVTDHDPLFSGLNFKGPGLLMWNARVPFYRMLKRGGHSPEDDEQTWAIATEIHHKPGDGVTPALFEETLRPMGFDVKLYPHNNLVGEAVFRGERGEAFRAFRAAQWLSGIRSGEPGSSMTMMCVARRA